ncbi:hypothetical protein DICA1_E12838 [Diutina catenulata]
MITEIPVIPYPEEVPIKPKVPQAPRRSVPFTADATKRMAAEIRSVMDQAVADPEFGVQGVVCGVTDASSTVYLDCAGYRETRDKTPLTTDATFMYFSCTKAFTVMAALILYDQGKLDFDVPVSTYLPEMEEVGIVAEDTVDLTNGDFLVPPVKPKNPVTARNLITHTAGFSYAFLNPEYMALAKKDRHINILQPTRRIFAGDQLPLTFEPGTQWAYGHNIDWLGLVIEEITGMKLGQFCEKAIFLPLGLKCSFYFNEYDKAICLYKRKRNGQLEYITHEKYELWATPEQDMGGQGCWGTIGDYLTFLRVYLNEGRTDDGHQLVSARTINYAMHNHLAPWLGVAPMVNDLGWDLDDDAPEDGWTLTGHAYNRSTLPSGRPEGSIYWSGIGNIYYWIDLKNKIAGIWGGSILPFLDEVTLESYRKFESTVYQHLSPKQKL